MPAAYWLGAIIVACTVTWLLTTANYDWQRARERMRQPQIARGQYAANIAQAEAERGRGWIALQNSLVKYALAIALVFILGLYAAGYLPF